MIAALKPKIIEFDLSHVFASATKEAEAAEQYVRVCHEPDGFDGVARVSPAATVRVEAVDHAVIVFGKRLLSLGAG